jgi:hypothetical protein
MGFCKNSLEIDFLTELAKIQAESIGWMPLEEGVYLHIGLDTSVIEVVGIPKSDMQGSTILWML